MNKTKNQKKKLKMQLFGGTGMSNCFNKFLSTDNKRDPRVIIGSFLIQPKFQMQTREWKTTELSIEAQIWRHSKT